MKRMLVLFVLSLAATSFVAEVAFAAKCGPGKRYYNGRCV